MDQVLHQVPGGGRPARIRSRKWRQPGTAGKRGVNRLSAETVTGAGAILRPSCFLPVGQTTPFVVCRVFSGEFQDGILDQVLNGGIPRGNSPQVRVDNGAFDAADRWLTRASCSQTGDRQRISGKLHRKFMSVPGLTRAAPLVLLW